MKFPKRDSITVQPGRVDLASLRRIARDGVELALDHASRGAIAASRAAVDAIVRAEKTAYGINTGFGLLAQTRIDTDRLVELQRNLVLSHACGTGSRLEDGAVRLILALKALSLARGHSGVRQEVVDALLVLLAGDVLPVIPAQGSVGASGDLAPLAHLAASLLGVGEMRVGGETVAASRGLDAAGLAPLRLQSKEGLALLNGTQVSTALALQGLFAAEDAFAAGIVTGALSVDAAQASLVPFDARIHALRGHAGQQRVAATLRRLLDGSAINASHVNCGRVQDPYSLRCQPQVMGACLDTIDHVARVLLIEANAVTDNPLVFSDTGEVLSGGNFHAEPVALAADHLALALSEIGAISERRIALLVDPKMSGMPAFLVENSGVNSGFMIAHVTAAALASENKSLAHPASVDSLPTSANQEDHVSMATFAARRLGPMAENTLGVLAVELLAAVQGIDFHRPHQTSAALRGIVDGLRQRVPFYEKDRYFAADLAAARAYLSEGASTELVGELLPSRGESQA